MARFRRFFGRPSRQRTINEDMQQPSCPVYTALELGQIPLLRYRQIRVLGGGSTGYMCIIQEILTEKYAVGKFVPLEDMDSVEMGKNLREAKIYHALNHPNITNFRRIEFAYMNIRNRSEAELVATSYQSWVSIDGPPGIGIAFPTHFVISMEYFEMAPMCSVLSVQQQSHMKEESAIYVFRQIVNGLAFLHSHGVYHRRIGRQEYAHIKLADFGFIKQLDIHSAPVTTWFIPRKQLPPELLYRVGNYNAEKLDVWSLGNVLYLITCGSYPFAPSDEVSSQSQLDEWRFNLRNGRFNLPRHVNSWKCKDALRDLLLRTLNPNPEDRPSITEVKEHVLYKDDSYIPEFARNITPERIAPSSLSDTVITRQNPEDIALVLTELEKIRRLVELNRMVYS